MSKLLNNSKGLPCGQYRMKVIGQIECYWMSIKRLLAWHNGNLIAIIGFEIVGISRKFEKSPGSNFLDILMDR